MSKIQIHRSTTDILEISYNSELKLFNSIFQDDKIGKKSFAISELEYLEIATDENVKSMNQSWDLNSAKKEIPTITPGALFGLVGLTVETLYKGYPLTFIATFKGGIKVLATAKSKLFEKIINDMK